MNGTTSWIADDPAGTAATAELRGEALVWQMLLHQAWTQIGNLEAWPHGAVRRRALDVAAEHVHAAEKVLRALDDALDPKQSDAGHALSVRHLQDRVSRERKLHRAVGHGTSSSPADDADSTVL